MLKSMSILLTKDQDKLFALYENENNDDTKLKIIDKLKQIDGVTALCKIAKIDEKFRESVLTYLIKTNKLDSFHAEFSLSWLNISKIHTDIINYIKHHYTTEQILQLSLSKSINPNAKKSLELIYLSLDKKAQENKDDERYLRLKMIFSDMDENELTEVNNESKYNENLTLKDIVVKYLKNLKSIDEKEKYKFIAESIYEIREKYDFDKSLIFLFFNLASLSLREKINLINQCKDGCVFFPEIFNEITEFKTSSYNALHHLFSTSAIKHWSENYLNQTYYYDLFYLKNNFPECDNIASFFEKNEIIKFIDSSQIVDDKLLSSRFNLFLTDLILNEDIKKILITTSKRMQETILNNIAADLSLSKKYLKALTIIGGDENLNFLNSLLTKTPVKDVKEKQNEIEQLFLNKKKSTNNTDELKKLINDEISEKEKLISIDVYHELLITWIEFANRALNFDQENISLLKNSLPDLKSFISKGDVGGNILICELISKLKLNNYNEALYSFLAHEDMKLVIHTAMCLKSIGDFKGDSALRKLSESKKTVVRKEIASIIHLYISYFDESLIINLICDENPKICSEALNSISKLPKNIAMPFYENVVQIIPHKNRIILANHLGNIKSLKAIGLLVELLNNGDFFDYKAVINALEKNSHATSLNLLQNMELNKNFTLEVEKAKALIVLGDYNGWQELKKYFSLSQGNISYTAKFYFLQLAGLEQIQTLKELCFDSDNKISSLAIAKILYFHEHEGMLLINEVLDNNNYQKIFYIALILEELDYQDIINELNKLSSKDDLRCKTINALIHAKNNNRKPLLSLERSVMSLTDSQNLEILEVISDFPINEAISLLKKMALLKNSQINNKLFDIMLDLKPTDIDEFLIDLWKQSDIDNRKIILDYIDETKNHNLIAYVKNDFDNNLNQIQVHIARSLINSGEEDYWKFLEQMTMSDDMEVKHEAIESIAKIDEKKSINILQKMLMSPSEKFVIDVIKTISVAKSRDIIPLLEKFVESSSNKVKTAVAKTLGSFSYSESKKLLEKLSLDRDEYVKVAVEISLEKIEKSSSLTNIPFNTILKKVLQSSDLTVEQTFINREIILFKSKYSEFSPSPLAYFKGKTILSQKAYLQKKRQIEDKMEKDIIGNSDVNSIMKIKEEATDSINKLTLKDELIISVFNFNNEKLNNEEAQIIFDIIKSEDDDLIKAFLLGTAKSNATVWINFYEKILNLKDLYKYIDIILFSLIQKRCIKVMFILVPHIENDKVKSYFVNFINFFTTHPGVFKKEKALALVEEIKKQKYDQDTKSALIELLDLFL